MKKVCILLVFCLLFSAFSLSVNSESADIYDVDTPHRVLITKSGERKLLDSEENGIDEIVVQTNVLVDFDSYKNGEKSIFYGVEIIDIEKLFRDEWLENLPNVYGYLITVPEGTDMDEAMTKLESYDDVLCSEPNNIISDIYNDYTNIETENLHFGDNLSILSDTYGNYDSETSYTPHYDTLDVEAAWNKGFTGSRDIKVAVIDTGAVHGNSDFNNNMNFSLAYDAINDVVGATAVSPIHPESPYHGHAVAGIIGADFGDGGINGICKTVTMIPIRISGSPESINRAFQYAMHIGCDIINYSFSLQQNETVYNLTRNADVLVVTSAGNNGIDITTDTSQAGKLHNLTNWIVVGECDYLGNISSSSNFHYHYVDIFAPSFGVPSINCTTNQYDCVYGTSFAAPMVTATAALVMSKATHLTVSQVRTLILSNDVNSDNLLDMCVSDGRLSVDKVVTKLYTTNRGAYSKGDLNGDGLVTNADYTLAYNAYMGSSTLNSTQRSAADINGNGSIDSTDYTLIKRFVNKTYYFIP